MTTDSLPCIETIVWPTPKVLAFTTTRLPPTNPLTPNNSLCSPECAQPKRNEFNGYDAFNLGEHVGDCSNNVAKNRALLLNELPLNTKIQWLEQVHGNEVVVVESQRDKPFIADAAITRKTDIALAVMTADCLPILLANKLGSEVAVMHAGWRPLAANIVARTIEKMQSSAQDIIAWLGPCIGKDHFEVGVEVKQAFIEQSPMLSKFFVINTHHKYQADLPGLATYLLQDAGVASIEQHTECTFALKDKYYSYRRESKTGRMASIICLN